MSSAAIIQCWCDLMLLLLTVDYSLVLLLAVLPHSYIASNSSIFSLFPSSWITIVLKSPSPNLPTFSLSPPPNHSTCWSPLSTHKSPVPPPPLLLCLPLSPTSSPSLSAPPSLQDFWQVWGVCRAACVHLNEKLHFVVTIYSFCLIYTFLPPLSLLSLCFFYLSITHSCTPLL